MFQANGQLAVGKAAQGPVQVQRGSGACTRYRLGQSQWARRKLKAQGKAGRREGYKAGK